MVPVLHWVWAMDCPLHLGAHHLTGALTILQLEALPHLVTGWVANPVRAGRPITATVLSLDAVLLHEHSRLPRDQGTATILSSNAVLLP